MLIINRLLKVTAVGMIAVIIIPTVSVSATSYEKEVKTKFIGSSNTSNKDKDAIINYNVAKAIGMDISVSDRKTLVVGKEYTDKNMIIITDSNKKEATKKYKDISTVSDIDNIDSYNMIKTNTDVKIKQASMKYKKLVTKSDINSYSEPKSKNSLVVNHYKKNRFINVTTITKHGYTLLYGNGNDEWVQTSKLCTEEEYKKSLQGTALLDIDNPDNDYQGRSVTLTDQDRDLLEHLVMGEAGGQGYIGASLVAQAIRDSIVYRGYTSVAEVRKACAYTGSINKTPNSDTLKAVSYIFDDGGYAVKHKVFFFYAPALCKSEWHESQHFVTQYKGHRFFSIN